MRDIKPCSRCFQVSIASNDPVIPPGYVFLLKQTFRDNNPSYCFWSSSFACLCRKTSVSETLKTLLSSAILEQGNPEGPLVFLTFTPSFLTFDIPQYLNPQKTLKLVTSCFPVFFSLLSSPTYSAHPSALQMAF